jgi:putative SOS response-associated peptidase YedK
MCGRYVSPGEASLERLFGHVPRDPFDTVYNAAPTLSLPVAIRGASELAVRAMQWGLIPSWWSKEELPTATINAQAETAAAKPMWRGALKSSRALIPALGWYEWRAGSPKQPFFIHLPDRAPFCFAGLWASWTPPGGTPLETFTIFTRAAAGPVAEVHHRMPVILPPSVWDFWLDASRRDGGALLADVLPVSVTTVQAYAVSTYVNSPRNQGEQCIAPLEAAR